MRLHNTPAKLFAAATLLVGAAGLVTVEAVRAAPTTAPAKPAMVKPENAGQHIQHLRAIRHTLNEMHDQLSTEPMADGDVHRAEALKAVQHAIDEVNTEVKDFEAAQAKHK